MSWHYLQEQGEACWPHACLDGAPDALSSLIPTPDESSSRDNATDASNGSRYGMTSRPSTDVPGAAQLTLFPEAFRAKTFPPLVVVQDLPGHVQDYFSRCSESLERFGLALSSPKTRQTFALADLSPLSKNLTAWGTAVDGVYWEHGTLARRTNETGCGSLDTFPTPTASEGGSNQGGAGGRVGKVRPSLGMMARRDLWPTPTVHGNYNKKGLSKTSGDGLATAVKKNQNWPTPTAHMTKEGGYPSEGRRNTPSLTFQAGGPSGGPLNPPWVEWLMGWPIGWTDLEPLAMDKYRQWLRLHGIHSPKG